MSMEFSQGGESNHNGRWLEHIVEHEMRERKIPIVDYESDLGNYDMFRDCVCVRRVPYMSIYGCHSTSEFVFRHGLRVVRIECRVQETPGSVDEKFPYLFENARTQMPEGEIVLLLHGSGARAEAVDWLKRKCKSVDSKTVHVFDVSEFRAWLKKVLKGVA